MSDKLTTRWKAGRIAPVLAKLADSRALRVALGAASTIAIGGGAAMGCLDRPIATNSPRTTSTVVDILTQSSVDKIDVLLMIDNSGSMADKQAILADAVPKLVARLVTPICVAEEGDNKGLPAEPAVFSDANGECPDGFEPEFKPVRDINIGVISSALGSTSPGVCPVLTGKNNQDNGRLLSRTQPGTDANDATTYEGFGFLAWDPDGERPCVGEGPTGEKCPGSADAADLNAVLTTMVQGVGEFGCGFEASLEAAYRFLADPAPWSAAADGTVDKETIDETLLGQRAAFLRPDSLLAVILLTDENDCSFRADGVGSFGASPQDAQPMPKARSECANDPDDPCCASCIDPIPDGCSGDGGCPAPGDQAADSGNFYEVDDDENQINTRCWDQKRRFGIDFLYPTKRYVNAFSQARIDPDKLDLAVGEDGSGGEINPIFTDLQDLGRTVRPPDLVFVAGIAGVPWQLIARKNADGEPDLNLGVNSVAGDNLPVGGFQSYAELEQNGVWKLLIPENSAGSPGSALMIESTSPRDLTDEDAAINGGEWTTGATDLQYACIFDLPPAAHRECTTVAEGINCDCGEGNDKPLCDPGEGEGYNSLQTRAKAYPGTRIFQVLNGLRDQGIPASICPAQLGLNGESVDAKDYGYTPAVFAIIDRLKTKLGGSCQPRQLVPDTEGNTPCIVIEARDSDGDKNPETTRECAEKCKEAGRAPIGEETKAAADKIQTDLDEEEPSPGYDCLCEIVQLQGSPTDESSDRYQCQNNESVPNGVDGWCYVDATTVPPTGNADLVAGCPATEQRLVRFVNRGEVSGGGRVYITCAGDAAGGEDEQSSAPAEEE